MQFADGRLAEPPIALCEVQAYAYDAAVRGAALLDGVRRGRRSPGWPSGPPPAATGSATRSGSRRRAGGHPAIALDGDGRPVDSVTSNMGHLLGTGLLDAAGAARVAELLADPRLDSGFGLRTLAVGLARAFYRLRYHGGTVWPHDTAIAVRGLAADGHRRRGRAGWPQGLLAAAEGVDYRLPELYGGDAAAEPYPSRPPTPPPAARRPGRPPHRWPPWWPSRAWCVDAAAGVVTHPARTSEHPRRLLAARAAGRRASSWTSTSPPTARPCEVDLGPRSRLRPAE